MISKVIPRSLFCTSHLYKNSIFLSFLRCRKCSQNIDSKSIPTIAELTLKLAQVKGIGPTFSPELPDRTHLSKYVPKSQKELPPRSMKDSYLAARVPLSTDVILRNKYCSILNSIRVGRLFEDMDIFAVMVAQKHLYNPKLPPDLPSPEYLVTILVHRIEFPDYIPDLKNDVILSGHVCWVGKSTIEVVVRLAQKKHGELFKITNALFLMGARNPITHKSTVVNPLIANTQVEKEIMERGNKRRDYRVATDKYDVSKALPDVEEQKIIHNLYMNTKLHTVGHAGIGLPPGGVWMEDCKLSTVILSQPEYRNLHNRVFGGFIMRQAVELSWVLGYKFTKHKPKFRIISNIKFAKPIDISAFLCINAYVVYTHMQYYQITVIVEIFKVQKNSSEVSNVLNFTYEAPEIVREVYPKSYNEAMMYIDGRRYFMEVMNPAALAKTSFLHEDGVMDSSEK